MEFLLVYRTTWKLLVRAVINGHSFVLSLVHSFVRSSSSPKNDCRANWKESLVRRLVRHVAYP